MIVIFIIICVTVWNYKKREKEMQTIITILDEALCGTTRHIQYDESMHSAISERLHRILQMNDLQKIKAQKESENVKSFVSDIAHQVRTPLSNILLYTGLLKERIESDEVVNLVEKIQAQSDKLDFLMKELVSSSHIEQDLIQVTCKELLCADIILPACQLVEDKAMKKGIMVIYDELVCTCVADLQWSVEAISNVLDNAIKYSKRDTTIHIDTTIYESFICIRIKDQGIGIEESQHGLIFQRFYRVAKQDDVQGFGIGLYLVREVVSKLGGYVKVESQMNHGTTFHLYFRRH